MFDFRLVIMFVCFFTLFLGILCCLETINIIPSTYPKSTTLCMNSNETLKYDVDEDNRILQVFTYITVHREAFQVFQASENGHVLPAFAVLNIHGYLPVRSCSHLVHCHKPSYMGFRRQHGCHLHFLHHNRKSSVL